MTPPLTPNLARVGPGKITDYLLSLSHPQGKGKANFFMKFGFTPGQAAQLQASMLKHARTQPVVQVKQSDHGLKYVLECGCESPDGRNPCIRLVWIVEEAASSPRLVTAHPAKT